MEERNVKVTLDKAKEWYNSGDKALKEIALQAFTEKELMYNFRHIKTFDDALNALGYNRAISSFILEIVMDIRRYSKASAAMFELNIIRKALNLGQDLHLVKDPKISNIYYPYNPFMSESSSYYEQELKHGKMEVIGSIKNEGEVYWVLGGSNSISSYSGLGYFLSNSKVGTANSGPAFLGCASDEIARHFGRYFGMLITEAKYGDIVDFEIVESKY